MTNEELREAVTELVADGGYDLIEELVQLVPIAKLKKEYDFLWEDDEL